MIGIGFAEFFAFLLIFFLCYVAWLWFRENNRVRRHEWELSNRRLFHCNQ